MFGNPEITVQTILPDWLMVLNAIIFIVVPIISIRLKETKTKTSLSKYKLLSISASWTYLLALFSMNLVEKDFTITEYGRLLVRTAFLAIGYSQLGYILNGWVFDFFEVFLKNFRLLIFFIRKKVDKSWTTD